ncbi:MAG: proline--tRNA ligase [Phycisphaerae bacterium]|jgi:prolyl-tRNA synthetase
MRWTEFFIPTTKEIPKDATAASHVLMLRAGLIRQLAAGIYSYLPLGYRTLRKVEQIVREEMDAAGAVELHMPVLQPLSLWEETGRTDAMGDTLLRLAGPEGDWRPNTVLGPTHEEVVTEIARAHLNSYKQLPVNLYQIQTKFRGEARPKSGVLRTREFLMKDAYSFDADVTGLDQSYHKMYAAYCRIFGRCGLPYLAVEAESGPIGGDSSHEFMVLTDAGEDLVVLSEAGDYAANMERATCAPHPAQSAEMRPLETVHTPGMGRVEDVCAFLKTSPAQMIKTLIYDLRCIKTASGKEIEWKGWIVALVRGDHEVNENKLRKIVTRALPDELVLHFEMATPQSIEELTNAAVGFAGPQGLADKVEKLIVDRDVATLRNAASGANRTDYHVINLNPGRDFPLEGERVRIGDIRNVTAGDRSPRGDGAALTIRKAIEVGHVFKLGTKYSDAMKATFLGKDGRPHPYIMGCYGIGLNRIVAAAIEAHHDDNGIIWPVSIAPFEALILALDPREAEVMRVAGEIHDKLAEAGVEVLFDDRDERAGFKFKDADLIGVPYRVVVGKKSLAEAHVEVSHRRDGEKKLLTADEAVEFVVNAIGEEQARLAATAI